MINAEIKIICICICINFTNVRDIETAYIEINYLSQQNQITNGPVNALISGPRTYFLLVQDGAKIYITLDYFII